MRKDLNPQQSANKEQRPVPQRNSFLSPWSNDWEPSKWFDMEPFPSFNWDNKLLSPAIDIEETDKEYVVCADMPGIKADDISVECSGDMLTISAERKYESGGKKSNRHERFYGTYQRSFTLPQDIDTESIEANYEDGVLDIHIPKSQQSERKKITIGKGRSQNVTGQKNQSEKH